MQNFDPRVKPEEPWARMLGAMISKTAQDFTIMIQIRQGKLEIGLVDLEFKMYTKAYKYKEEWDIHKFYYRQYLK
jgi:hypothetical protein